MSDLSDGAAWAIETAVSELREKGWENIECINGEPDSLTRWKVKVRPYDPLYNKVLYTLIGSRDGIDIGVRIAFNEQTESWEAAGVYYVDSLGKQLMDRAYTTFVEETGKDDLILAATDPDLRAYFE